MLRLPYIAFGLAILPALIGDLLAQPSPESQPQNKSSPLSAQQSRAQPTPSVNVLTPEQITKSIADGINAAAKQYETRHPTSPPDNFGWWFNFLLVTFTGGLVTIGAGQCFLFYWTLKATQIAADAANLSAQAAIGLQLPRLIVGMALFQPGQPYGANKPYSVRIENGLLPEWTQVAIRFNNVGRTNALVTEQCYEYFVGARLPKLPQYKLILPAPAGEIIQTDGSWQLEVTNRFIQLSTEQRYAIETPEFSHHLWVYGLLRFTDFMGNPHESRFCERWTRLGFVSESDTPAEYTRSQ